MSNKINAAMRFFLLVIGSVILLGMWLTGFDKTHWLLYVPVVFFYFAAVTGICPGLVFSGMLFPDKAKTATKARRKKR
jgi:ABC-type polysaccharide/polyol phosphate export permease